MPYSTHNKKEAKTGGKVQILCLLLNCIEMFKNCTKDKHFNIYLTFTFCAI
jgi:hypothetical protein